MKRAAWVAVVAALAAGAARGEGFALSSAELREGGRVAEAQVFDDFGCKGGNRSPALAWTAPPAGTKSLALTVFDPDAPTGHGWWHWVVVNLPAATHSLPAGAGGAAGKLPAGAVQATNDFGSPAYGGPCPPEGGGEHRYVFTVHALKVARLAVRPETGAAEAAALIRKNELAAAKLTARYGR